MNDDLPPTLNVQVLSYYYAVECAGAFRKIVGIDINSRLIEMAQLNIAMNKVGDNCVIARAPAAKAVTKILHKYKPHSGGGGGGGGNGRFF